MDADDIYRRRKCPECETLNMRDYTPHVLEQRQKATKPPQTDAALLTGHYCNNLKLPDADIITKTYPYVMEEHEDYADFLERLKKDNSNAYKRIFKDTEINYYKVKAMLKDRNKSEYGKTYSPSYYMSLQKQKHLHEDDVLNFESKNYLTTYGNYHSRLYDVDHLKDALYAKHEPVKPSVIKRIKEKQRKPFFRNVNPTTYYDEICFPALYMYDDNMPTSYTDKHINRKI